MDSSNYEAKISWLFQQFPSFQKVGNSAFNPTLDNTLELVHFLNISLDNIQFIHVAGTNGKGTTCSILASALTEAGYKTGLFTSPHIKDFRERIRINGEMINQKEVICFIDLFQQEKFSFSPSFFEMTWAIALAYFAAQKCEYVVVETGIGGRLDATNIITPKLSIITNVGLDHIEILGSTRPEIAQEKAGIIKENTPVIIGEGDQEINPIFEKVAQERNAELHFCPPLKEVNTFLQNKHTAFYALEHFLLQNREDKEEIKQKALQNLQKNAGWYGRFEIIHQEPLTIVDVAHNSAGAKRLLTDIQALHYNKKVHVLYGSSNDKDISEIIALLPQEWNYHFTEFSSKRSAKTEEFQELLKDSSLAVIFYKEAKEAYKDIITTASKDDLILIFGSFYLLEDIYLLLEEKKR